MNLKIEDFLNETGYNTLKEYNELIKKHYYSTVLKYNNIYEYLDKNQFSCIQKYESDLKECYFIIYYKGKCFPRETLESVKLWLNSNPHINEITLITIYIPKKSELTEMELLKKENSDIKKKLAEIKELLKKMVV